MRNINQAERRVNPAKIGLAALSGFLKVADKWQLKQEQQRVLLGDIPKTIFHTWKIQVENAHEIKLHKDTLERISYILGIYKDLNILLPSTQAANQWVHQPNQATLFNGKTALEKMLAGNVIDLADVRRYLDALRGEHGELLMME